MEEIKKIKVKVTGCDSMVHSDGKCYLPGEFIENFPYVEKDHSKHLTPAEETVEEIKPAIKEQTKEEIKAEEPKSETVVEPVKRGKRK